jgi:hypothetical protein
MMAECHTLVMDDGDDMHLPHRERVHGQLARLMAGKVDLRDVRS